MTSLKTSIKTITYLSDIGCLEIQGASLQCLDTSERNMLRTFPENVGMPDVRKALRLSTSLKIESNEKVKTFLKSGCI
jgi:hypothetical protein